MLADFDQTGNIRSGIRERFFDQQVGTLFRQRQGHRQVEWCRIGNHGKLRRKSYGACQIMETTVCVFRHEIVWLVAQYAYVSHGQQLPRQSEVPPADAAVTDDEDPRDHWPASLTGAR